jgi:hypothetical protein
MKNQIMISTREAARILGVSHTAIRLSINEDRACQGLLLTPYAIFDEDGGIKGLLRGEWSGDRDISTRIIPPENFVPYGDERPLVQKSREWDWAEDYDDLVNGKPIFGAVYGIESERVARLFGFSDADSRHNIKTFVLSKFTYCLAGLPIDLLLLSIDQEGRPIHISLTALMVANVVTLTKARIELDMNALCLY